MKAYLFSLFFMSLYGTLQHFGWDFINRTPLDPTRSEGAFADPQALGGYLALGLPLALFFIFSESENLHSKLAILPFSLGTAALLFTKTRASLLAFLFSLLLFLYILLKYAPSKRKKCLFFLSLLLIFLLLAIYFLNIPLIPLFKNILQVGGGRLSIWKNSLFLLAKKPLYGYGVNSFILVSIADDKPMNEFIEIAVGSGFFALLCLIWIFSYAFLATKKYLQHHKGQEEMIILKGALISSCLAYIVHSFFSHANILISALFWVIFGVSLSFLPSYTVSWKQVNFQKWQPLFRLSFTLIFLLYLTFLGTWLWADHEAEIARQTANHPSSLSRIDQAIRLNPWEPMYHDLKAKICLEFYKNTGNFSYLQIVGEESLKAARLNPRFIWSYKNAIFAYLLLLEYEKASSALNEMLALSVTPRESTKVYLDTAEGLIKAQFYREARLIYKKILSFNPSCKEAKLKLEELENNY
jgi:tetratricopeptide (TPR) repeat protein